MKNLIWILILAFAISSCSTKKTIEPYKLAEKLTYSVNLENPENDLPDLENFESKDFTDNLLKSIENKSLEAYKFNVKEKLPITYDDIKKTFGAGERKTIMEQDGKEVELTIHIELRSEEVKDYIFIEDWLLNENTLEISKDVNGIAAVRPFYEITDSSQVYKEAFPFMVYFNEPTTKNENIKVICPRAEYIISLDECDSLHTDFAKLNSKKLIDLMLEKVLNRDIKVYDYFFNKKITVKEVLENFDAGKKSVMVENIESGQVVERTIEEEIRKKEITGLLFVEEWLYDETNFSFEKNIIAYGPVREYYRTANPEQKVKTVPFLIYFDK